MPITVQHIKSVTIPDSTDSNIVRPSDWNSSHAITYNPTGVELSGAFSNANGISFGTNTASQLTASHNGLTTAAQSNHSHGNPTLNLTNLSGTTASASNGLTLSMSAAAQTVQPVAYSAANGSANFSTLTFANSNGVSFSSGTQGVFATVKTDYLTTARSSNDAIGLNSALTGNGVSMTANSNGLSLNIPAFLTTAAQSGHSHGNPTLNLTNLSGTTASNSAGFTLSLSAAAGGGGADGYNILAAGTQTATTAGTVQFADSNGISFGMSGSTRITASHNGLTTAAQSNHSHGNPSLNLTNLSGTTASNSAGLTLSLSAAAQTAQPVAYSAANGSANFSTLTFANSNGVSFSSGTQGLYATVKTDYLTTARASNDAIGLNTALTANGVSMTANSSGLSLNIPAFLTTAAQSGHSHGNPTLNLTNLSGTTASNSAGFTLSLSAAAGGGGADGYNILGVNGGGTALSTTIQLSNANNVSFGLNAGTITASASYAAQTVQPVAFSASGGSSNFSTLVFTNSNGITISNSGGSVQFQHGLQYSSNTSAITANALNTSQSSLFQHTSATSAITSNAVDTANSSLFQHTSATSAITANAAHSTHSHGAVNFGGTNVSGSFTSQSNGLTISLSAPTPGGGGAINVSAGTTSGNLQTIQFNNANGVSFGLNGSTVTASAAAGGGGITFSGYNPYADHILVAGQLGMGTLVVDPEHLPNVSLHGVQMPVIFSNASNSSGSATISNWVGLYTNNAGTLSLHASTSNSIAITNSGTVGNYSLISGMRNLTIPWSTSFSEGQYWLANISRVTTAGGNFSASQMVLSQVNSNFVGILGASHNTTMQYTNGQGMYTATTSGLPSNIQFSQLRGSDSMIFRAPPIGFFYT